MHRRSFLAAAASTVAAVGTAAGTTAGTTGRDTTGAAAQDEEPTRDGDRGPVRGEADVALSVEVEEDDEHVTFVDDDEVRYVMGWTSQPPEEEGEPPEREPLYDTMPWERWGRLQATTPAAEEAAAHVRDELDVDVERVGAVFSSRVPDRDSAAVVSVQEREDGPTVDVETVAAVTPATVDVTYRLEGREYEHEAPIYARVQEPVDERFDEDLTEGEANAGEPLDQPADAGASDPGDENGSDPAETNESDPADANGSDPTDENGTSSEAPDESDADALPGFGAVAALGALGTAAVGYARRDRSDERE